MRTCNFRRLQVNTLNNSANEVCQKKELKVAGEIINVRRYFSDFQIFINKLHDDITRDKVAEYFSRFGKVKDVAITEAHTQEHDHTKPANRHCYVKFANEDDVDKCLFEPKHQINNYPDIKVVRTYRIGENEESDRKIFIKIVPQVQKTEDMEKWLNVDLF